MLDIAPRLEANYILSLLDESTARFFQDCLFVDLIENKISVKAKNAEEAFSLRFNYHNQLVQALTSSQDHSIQVIEYEWCLGSKCKKWTYPLTMI